MKNDLKRSRIQMMLIAGVIAVFLPMSLSAGEKRVMDLRERLLESARLRGQEEFGEENLQNTHFSYFGKVSTNRGFIHVVDERFVVKNMNAPRGLNFIAFFDQRYRFLGKIKYCRSRPLWCEGSRVYLWGELDEECDKGRGNVIELAGGFGQMKVFSEKKYGSLWW